MTGKRHGNKWMKAEHGILLDFVERTRRAAVRNSTKSQQLLELWRPRYIKSTKNKQHLMDQMAFRTGCTAPDQVRRCATRSPPRRDSRAAVPFACDGFDVLAGAASLDGGRGCAVPQPHRHAQRGPRR